MGLASTNLCSIVALLCVVVMNILGFYIYYGNSTPLNHQTCSTSTSTRERHIQFHQKQCKIIYYKTHKTASTTVGSIFFRFGANHGRKFHTAATHIPIIADVDRNITIPEADITLHHHVPIRHTELMAYYRSFIPNGSFITVLRDPAARYLSHYYYFYSADNKTFSEFLTIHFAYNFMARDLGVFNETDLVDFFDIGYKQFIFIILEYFDETLLLLKQRWHWTLSDVLYIKLNDACSVGYRDFDKKPLVCFPTKENLTKEEWETIKDNNKMDYQLYEKALHDTRALLAAQGQDFWDELQQFQQMIEDLRTSCVFNSSVQPLCEPFLWMDLEYEQKIAEDGRVHDGVPLVTVNYEK